MKTKKMKKLGVALLSAALLLIPCVSLVNAKENPYDDWKTTALQSPQKGKLVAAGDIEVKWDLLTSAKVKQYDVYFDGEFVETVDANTNETTVYTTKVSKHTVRIVAVLENEDEVNISERTFYVSKKGLGFYEADGANSSSYAQNMGLSWYYNWSEQPFNEEGAANSNLEFVPMIYNDDTNAGTMASRLDLLKEAGYNQVLSFNEPDASDQAAMDYERAASYNKAFANSGLKVGSPAVVWDATEDNGWFSNYWKQLDIKDDFIAIHRYPGYVGLNDDPKYTPKDAAKEFLDYIASVYEEYQKPIWITEFAVAHDEQWWHPYDGSHEEHNEAVQEFMDYVINGFDDVAGLDELSFVERYAWFSFGSTSERGGSSALFFNKEDEKKTNKTKASLELGELTDLGDIYRSIGLPEEYTLPDLDGSIDISKIIEDQYIVDPQYTDSDNDLDDKKDDEHNDPNKDLDNNKDDKDTTNNDQKEENGEKDDKNNNEQKPLQNVSNSTSNSSDESKGQETDKKEVNDQKQTNDNTEKTYVKTGDQTSYVILLLMMFASLIGIFLLKNKKEY